MNRHAKSLQSKSRHHIVTHLNDNLFDVESFTSGDSHLVRRSFAGHLSCDCTWAAHHPYKVCSHILAVHEWEANANTITLSFWTDYADVLRQHRSVVRVDSDLLATQRRVPVDPAQEALRLIVAQDAAAMVRFINHHDPDYQATTAAYIETLTLWTAGVVSNDPFCETDTHRAVLRTITAYSLTGQQAIEAAQAAL